MCLLVTCTSGYICFKYSFYEYYFIPLEFMALPEHIERYLPYLVSLCDIFTDTEVRRLLAQGDRGALEVSEEMICT